MKKKLIYGLLFAVAMVTASSSFVSCKDYEGDDYAGLKEENLSLRDALNKQIAGMSAYALKSDLQDWALKSDLKDWALKSDLKDWALKTDLDAYVKITDYVNDSVKQNQWILAIQKSVEALKNDSVSKYAELIHNNNKSITYVTALAKNDSIRIDALENALQGWGPDLTEAVAEAAKVAATVAADSAKWNATTETVNEKSEIWNKAVEVADSAWNWIKSGKDAKDLEYKNLAEMIKDFKDADKALQDQIDDLNQDIANILGTLKKQISGVIVQGTYSPVFGYGSLPLGIQTNILAAYVGTAVTDVQFPAALPSFDNKYIITEADQDWLESKGVMPDAETITAGQTLVNDTEGNAGKMYLTVNPTNVDFSGTDFKLVNSKGYESLIKLSTLDASDEVLNFGWTRGTTVRTESANGFYEVTATVSKEDALKIQPVIDKAGFKEAVMEAADCQTCVSVKDVARALYNSLQPTQRFGVKAEWTDPVVGERSVTSAFDIAAMSIKPLGFGFKVPGAGDKLSIPNLKKVVAEKLHIDLSIDPIVITAQDKATGKYILLVEIPEMYLDADLMAGWTGEMYDGKLLYYLNDFGGAYTLVDAVELRTGYAYFDFTPMFEELFGQFNAAFENFNTAAADFNKKIDKIASEVNSYIDRANGWISRINTLLQNVGNAVQPVLIWSDGKNAGELGGFVSANYAVGTVVPKDGQLALIPTSYSLELFAPAYKKSLIVTNAYKGGLSAQSGKDINLEEAVIALNKDIKAKGFDVFSGTSLKNQYIFNAKGYEGITFEIAYTAVDYEGKIAGRKFYLTVGE